MQSCFSWFMVIAFLFACQSKPHHMEVLQVAIPHHMKLILPCSPYVHIRADITMDSYFESMDALCREIDSVYKISLNEYELIHANRRVLDTLMQQDYYIAKQKGRFIPNQRKCIAIHAGDSLRVPKNHELQRTRSMLESVTIDVNIPEYKLRIYVGDSIVHVCSVRVGKNERKLLALAGHEVDLRTPVGEGSIIRIERDPLYINPVDGHRYSTTRRDDGRSTALPRIPFLEPVIHGRRDGALIHPTTNRSTLGKAISNGCVGVSEADAWMVYYYAPIGTRVRFRYELVTMDLDGKPRKLKDIYGRSKGFSLSNSHVQFQERESKTDKK